MYLNAFLPITNFSIQIGDLDLKIYTVALIFIAILVVSRFFFIPAYTLKLKVTYLNLCAFVSFLYFASRSVDLNALVFLILLYFVFVYNFTLKPSAFAPILMLAVIAVSVILYYVLPDNCTVNDYRVIDRSIFTNDICAVRYESGETIRLMGFSSDPNHWSLFVVAVLFLLSKVNPGLAVAPFLANILTFSRAGFASSLMVIFNKFGIVVKLAALSLSVPVAFALLYFVRGYELDISEIGRLVIWMSYITTIFSDSLLNILFGNGADLIYTIAVDGSDFDRAPHNTLILVIYQFGLFGLLMFSIFLWYVRKELLIFLPFLLTLDLFYSPVFWMIMGLILNKRFLCKSRGIG
jgi:hypothetical protein